MANEGELSKRIDDLHRRFDDLRGDVGRQFADLRADMATRFQGVDDKFVGVNQRLTDMHQRIDDLRADMNQRMEHLNQRLTDMHGTLRTFMWVVSGWFMFLTAVLAVFGFLRL